MDINWTTVIASGVTASIISVFTFLTTRYLTRMLDRIESRLQITDGKIILKKENGNKVKENIKEEINK